MSTKYLSIILTRNCLILSQYAINLFQYSNGGPVDRIETLMIGGIFKKINILLCPYV